eukprot:5233994-Pleurochrysis_carterae.AAC.1
MVLSSPSPSLEPPECVVMEVSEYCSRCSVANRTEGSLKDPELAWRSSGTELDKRGEVGVVQRDAGSGLDALLRFPAISCALFFAFLLALREAGNDRVRPDNGDVGIVPAHAQMGGEELCVGADDDGEEEGERGRGDEDPHPPRGRVHLAGRLVVACERLCGDVNGNGGRRQRRWRRSEGGR